MDYANDLDAFEEHLKGYTKDNFGTLKADAWTLLQMVKECRAKHSDVDSLREQVAELQRRVRRLRRKART